MTATATEETTTSETAAPGFKPRYIALLVAIAFATLIALSYAAELVFDSHDDSNLQRPYFLNIPDALRLAFYVTMVFLKHYKNGY